MPSPDSVTPAGRRASRPAEAAALRGLRTATLATWAALFLLSFLQLFVRIGHFPPLLVAGLLVGLAHQAGTALTLYQHRYTPRAVAVNGALFVTSAGLMMPEVQHIEPANLWAPGFWGLAWTGTTLVSLSRRGYLWTNALVFPLLMTAYVGIHLVTGPPFSRLTLEPLTGFLTPVALFVIFGDALLRIAHSSDEQMERREQAEVRRERERLESEGRQEAARLLHDHVLHALHALSRDEGRVAPEMVVEECRDAVEKVGNHERPEPTVRLEEMLAEDVARRPAVALVGTTPPMPHSVARSMADATHEALQNVARHAHAARVTVRVHEHAGQWTCSITDDGVGFDPERLPKGRLGIRRSIQDRLDDLGGSARISSRPGKGTRVELRWPSDEQVRDTADDPLPARARRAIALSAWPDMIGCMLLTALLAPTMHPWWPSVLGCLLLVGVGAAYMRVLGRRPPTLVDLSVMLLAAAMAWTSNLWTGPQHPTNVAYLWMGWGCTAMAHMVVLQLRRRRALGGLAAWAVVMVGLLLWRSHGHVDWQLLHPSFSVGIGEGLITYSCFALTQRLTSADLQARRRTERVRRATARLRLRDHLERYWSHQVTAEALPLMEAVARGAASPLDPSVRAQADRLEAVLRDELVLGPDRPLLLALLARIRDEGWQVTRTLTVENSPDELDAMTHLLERLGPPARPRQPVTLSGIGERASAVVLEPSEEQCRRWATSLPTDEVHVDPDFARLLVRHPGPARATTTPRRGADPDAATTGRSFVLTRQAALGSTGVLDGAPMPREGLGDFGLMPPARDATPPRRRHPG